jgi:hypothetical protein
MFSLGLRIIGVLNECRRLLMVASWRQLNICSKWHVTRLLSPTRISNITNLLNPERSLRH